MTYCYRNEYITSLLHIMMHSAINYQVILIISNSYTPVIEPIVVYPGKLKTMNL